MTARILAVCTGTPRPLAVGRRMERSAIDKQPREGAVVVGPLGLDGDTQGDQHHHGGIDQALYAYGQADAEHWEAQLGRALPAGAFGENLRVADLDVSAARIGERWRIGADVRVEVSAPRIPCATLAAHWEVPDIVDRFLAAGRPGAYLRVLRPGTIATGDEVTVLDRPGHEVTVAEVSRIRTVATAEAARLIGLDGLATRLAAWAERQAGRP